MDLINISDSSVIAIDPNQYVHLLRGVVQASPAVIAALLSTLVAIYSIRENHKMNLRLEEQKNEFLKNQRQHQLYSQLVGTVPVVSRLYSSYFYAYIDSQCCTTPNELKYNEYLRSQELALELAKANQHLWEIIGEIQILFGDTSRLKELIRRIKQTQEKYWDIIKNIREFTKLQEKLCQEQINKWKIDKELPDFINLQMNPVMDELLDYLKTEIDINGRK